MVYVKWLYNVSIKFWQNINLEPIKIEYPIISSQYFGNFVQKIFVTSQLPLQNFQNIGLKRHLILKSSSLGACTLLQNMRYFTKIMR